MLINAREIAARHAQKFNYRKLEKWANDSRCLTKFEIFFYKPVADLLKIPALAFILGN